MNLDADCELGLLIQQQSLTSLKHLGLNEHTPKSSGKLSRRVEFVRAKMRDQLHIKVLEWNVEHAHIGVMYFFYCLWIYFLIWKPINSQRHLNDPPSPSWPRVPVILALTVHFELAYFDTWVANHYLDDLTYYLYQSGPLVPSAFNQ